MIALIGMGIVLVALGAFFIPRYRSQMLTVAFTLIVLIVTCFMFLNFGPKDYMVKYPYISNILHPYRLGLYCFVMLVISLGIFVGSGLRWLYDRRKNTTA